MQERGVVRVRVYHRACLAAAAVVDDRGCGARYVNGGVLEQGESATALMILFSFLHHRHCNAAAVPPHAIPRHSTPFHATAEAVLQRPTACTTSTRSSLHRVRRSEANPLVYNASKGGMWIGVGVYQTKPSCMALQIITTSLHHRLLGDRRVEVSAVITQPFW